MEIDLFLKSRARKMSVRKASSLLDIPEDEVRAFLRRENIGHLDGRAFLKIMREGSSLICGMYRRELECESPFVYSREEIAYIYGIALGVVNDICDSLRIKEATKFTLPEILARCVFSVKITC
jgi:hypothetical protein